MFSNLIANRGEIAIRIIRACRDPQISPSTIYLRQMQMPCTSGWPTKDCVGEAASRRLSQHRCGPRRRKDAPHHPSRYGFAENADFAQATRGGSRSHWSHGGSNAGAGFENQRAARCGCGVDCSGTTELLQSFAKCARQPNGSAIP